ncbi:ATP-binding protein [Clostridium sp. BL-8]|uniref:ATP-binding protein n=1 Tax=Clostridium sp. BL-8 TaxID=349938 RepID=UPI00098C5490|nr:ATP-binding protein [Clostridium sp. BL-8]OOM79129.1 globin-coupled histidine kinase [Clostridium sp. BL-8]
MIFKTKSRAIELLGRKQIRDGTTALAELLKNSYDADAEYAKAIFNTEFEIPYLILVDSGFGMTGEDIIDKWLVIGTNSKKRGRNEERRTPNGRMLMGEKGIGRLASACLGEQLLLFSKSEKDRKWSVVFIDWNVFENPYSFIEDVDVGTYFSKEFHIFDDLSKIIEEMRLLVFNNINKDSWFDIIKNENGSIEEKQVKNDLLELRGRIEFQLNELSIPYKKILNQLNNIEKKGKGTLMLISNLREDWNRILNPMQDKKDKDGDSLAATNNSRLQTFLYPLNHTQKDKFEVSLFYNDTELAIEAGFSDEDYEIYDVKIDGEVLNGKFYGSIDVINGDKNSIQKCNEELESGIDIADTIPYDMRRQSDCGRFKIKFCHIEGTKKNTALEESVWLKQTQKLNTYGGVMIYRDGVRILPYGEPENDFLELEKRRLLRAGDYIFSHRRLFGRIDITYNDNPALEDKSSREGFIENEQYHYFITILKTLLIKIAVNYLNGTGIRTSYVDYNRALFDKKFEEEKAIKEQKNLLNNEKNKIKIALETNEKKFKSINKSIEEKLENYDKLMQVFEQKITYDEISLYYNQLDIIINSIEKDVAKNKKDLIIKISEKFKSSLPEEMVFEASVLNSKLLKNLDERLEILKDRKEELNVIYQNKLNEWRKSIINISGDSIENYKEALFKQCNSLNKEMVNIVGELSNEIEENLVSYKQLIEIIHNEAKSVNEIEINLRNKVFQIEKDFIGYLEREKYNINNLDKIRPEDIKNKINDISIVIREISDKLRNKQIKLKDEIMSIEMNISPKLRGFGEFINNEYDVQHLVDALTKKNAELEKENEIMADLANVGLAAEIVDHEFNQYFTNVTNAIRDLKKTKLNQAGNYYLNQIEVGFRAIGNRHSQLSPMYRSYNIKKKEIKILDMIEQTVEFFRLKIQNSGIDIRYEINPEARVTISPSKIYPVFSNLLDNAIYWTLSSKERIILWRYNEEERSLYIEDTGPGINPRVGNRIFDKFYSQKPYGLGRGLGLTITKKVLEMEGHNINIILEANEKKLAGACFKITFGGER